MGRACILRVLNMEGGMPPRTSFAVDEASSSAESSSSGESSSPPQSARAGGGPSAAMLNASVDVDTCPASLPPAVKAASEKVVVSAPRQHPAELHRPAAVVVRERLPLPLRNAC